MDIIRSVRNIRAEVNVPMSKKIELMIKPAGESEAAILSRNGELHQPFLRYIQLEIDIAMPAPDKAMTAVVTGAELYLPLAGLIDIAQEIARLEKEFQA